MRYIETTGWHGIFVGVKPIYTLNNLSLSFSQDHKKSITQIFLYQMFIFLVFSLLNRLKILRFNLISGRLTISMLHGWIFVDSDRFS